MRPNAAACRSSAAGPGCSLSRQPHRHALTPSLLPQRRQQRSVRSADSGSAAVGSGWMDMPESTPLPENVEVFPRLKERDLYKRLGVEREASFEEVQEARNFLYEQYKAHEPSREAIELAFDAILQEKMRLRHKLGFRPPQRGKKTDVAGELKLSAWQRVRGLFEPSVPGTTLVNDGSIFLALALWAAWQVETLDPTLPVALTLAYSTYKLFDKRRQRNPDGPYLGGNPVFGALGVSLLALVASGVIGFGVAQLLPLPPRLSVARVGAFVMTMLVGLLALYVK